MTVSGFEICGPNSGYCGVPGSYVWVWRAENDVIDGEHTNPVCIPSGQAWADACHHFASREFYVVDTRGDWFQVVERPYIGFETVSVSPPRWIEG